MRSKNSRPHDAIESAYLADVKRCACVVCNAPPPVEAHHPEQGLHLTAIAVCPDCHGGPGHPHGWHGDKSRWRVAKMTEMRAINETRRRVELLRAGKTEIAPPIPPLRRKSRHEESGSELLPKIVRRPWAA